MATMTHYYSIYNQAFRGGLIELVRQSNPKLRDLPDSRFISICVLDAGLKDLAPDSLPLEGPSDKTAPAVFQALLPDDMEMGWIYTGRTLALIIACPKDQKENETDPFPVRIAAACQGIIHNAEESFGSTISLAIGSVYSDIQNCEESIREALIIAQFCRFVEFPAQIVDHDFFENLRGLIRKQYPDYRQENYERPMIAAILNRNFIHAELILNNLLIAHLLDPIHIFPMLNSTIENMTRLCMALIAPDPKKMAEENAQFGELQLMLRNSRSLKRMQKSLHLFFRMLNDYVQESYEAIASNRKVQRIVDFVDEHYADPQLDAAVLCHKFNISPSYLSRAFKEHSGINLSTYLQSLRITKAKRLLTETEMAIEKIAVEVGCSSGQNLLRLFKKLEGVNPTIYRSLAKADLPGKTDKPER